MSFPPSLPISQRDRAIMLVLVALSLLAKVAAWKSGAFVDTSDSGLARQTAAEILGGKTWFSPFLDPGMSLFLTPFYSVFGVKTDVPRYVLMIAGLCGAFYSFGLTRLVAGGKAARIAFVVMLFDPIVVYYSFTETQESLLLLTLPAFLFHLVAAGRRCRIPHLFAAAVALAVSSLLRGWTVTLLPASFAYRLVVRGRGGWRAAALETCLIAALCAALLLPWATVNFKQLGRAIFFSENWSLALFLKNNPLNSANSSSEPGRLAPDGRKWTSNEMFKLIVPDGMIGKDPEAKTKAYRYALNYIAQEPIIFIKRCGKVFFQFWSHPNPFGYEASWRFFEIVVTWKWIVWTVALMGFAVMARGGSREHWALAALLTACTLYHVFIAFSPFYKDGLFAAEIPYFAIGAAWLWESWRAYWKGGWKPVW